MTNFEKYIREQAVLYPDLSILEAIEDYDELKQEATFNSDPVAWAMEQPTIMHAIHSGRTVLAVVELRKLEYVDIHTAKNIVFAVKERLGLR